MSDLYDKAEHGRMARQVLANKVFDEWMEEFSFPLKKKLLAKELPPDEYSKLWARIAAVSEFRRFLEAKKSVGDAAAAQIAVHKAAGTEPPESKPESEDAEKKLIHASNQMQSRAQQIEASRRGPGRPKGSKNKPKPEQSLVPENELSIED